MNVTYLIGEPGVGKTTLVENLVQGWVRYDVRKPFAHQVYRETGVVQLGPAREAFGGTDGLSMSVQPKVVEWLSSWDGPEFSNILGEGDRLATDSFFQAVGAAGATLNVIHVVCDAATAEHRRQQRAQDLGSKPQDPTWLKGRRSKVARLAETWATATLDTTAGDVSLGVIQSDPVLSLFLKGA